MVVKTLFGNVKFSDTITAGTAVRCAEESGRDCLEIEDGGRPGKWWTDNLAIRSGDSMEVVLCVAEN